MKKVVILLSLISIGLWACAGSKVEKPGSIKPLGEQQPNQCPTIQDVSLSESTVRGGEQIRIAVTASDPEQDQLFYSWSASKGDMSGREAQVVWTAPQCSEIGQPTATYDISVDVTDGKCSVNRLVTVTVDCGASQAESTIIFPAGSVKLDNIAKAQLDKVAALLKQFPDQTIALEGHSDATGKEEANKQMGLKRAESVKQYLVKRHGIDLNRITTTSAGSTKPVAPNDTEAGRAQNRRVGIYRK
jgi:outer membrane protein OmpA-like peptidoglycan-associated protein